MGVHLRNLAALLGETVNKRRHLRQSACKTCVREQLCANCAGCHVHYITKDISVGFGGLQYNTLAKQRRHVEALEVLRTLESLEWREAESQREEAEQRNEAELEVSHMRRCSYCCCPLCEWLLCKK